MLFQLFHDVFTACFASRHQLIGAVSYACRFFATPRRHCAADISPACLLLLSVYAISPRAYAACLLMSYAMPARHLFLPRA
jgi:hypothetical protein